MYTAHHAAQRADKPAIIFVPADGSDHQVITFGEFDARSNQLAHLLRSRGLKRLDHYSTFMENHPRYMETAAAGERSGLYHTCVNSYLTADELAYIIDNSESRVLITSMAKAEIAFEAAQQCPNLELTLVVGAGTAPLPDGVEDYETAIADCPTTPIADECIGTSMLYSSGTTGRPKGILRPLPEQHPSEPMMLFTFLGALWQYREDMTYLSPAPLYHSAPQAAVGVALRTGGTSVVMERFEPAKYLALIERYQVTHSQLVPTMFSRMLKLPEEERTRHDLSSLEIAIHAAAPCPAQVKEQMIEWWGPIIHEYYGATEALGFTTCDTAEWLAHRGTVGKVVSGVLHILDDDMNELPVGQPGTIWFETATEFSYHRDPEKTAESTSPDGTMTTVGDIGYVDEDGYLYLTDRKTFMIISGGVNIYPQETENLLISHPSVLDAAVIGVPNEDLGEEVKAVVQLVPGVAPDQTTTDELLAHCREHLSRQKVPRSIDYRDELPRLPTGKLYKRLLRDEYWGESTSRIV